MIQLLWKLLTIRPGDRFRLSFSITCSRCRESKTLRGNTKRELSKLTKRGWTATKYEAVCPACSGSLPQVPAEVATRSR